MQLDAAAAALAELEKPIMIAKVDADKYRRLGDKYEIEYAIMPFIYLTTKFYFCLLYDMKFQVV